MDGEDERHRDVLEATHKQYNHTLTYSGFYPQNILFRTPKLSFFFKTKMSVKLVLQKPKYCLPK